LTVYLKGHLEGGDSVGVLGMYGIGKVHAARWMVPRVLDRGFSMPGREENGLQVLDRREPAETGFNEGR
jgi:hypothetical protein